MAEKNIERPGGAESNAPPRHIAIILDGNGRWARRRGLTDPNLLDFSGYALSFFASSTVRQAASALRGAQGIEQTLLWLLNTNIGYYSGRLGAAKENEGAMRLLMERAPF